MSGLSQITTAPVLSDEQARTKISSHGSAWAIIYRCADASDESARTDQQKRGKVIRERLVSEYQNNALVNALILTLVATAVMNPSQDITMDPTEPRFRVYIYCCSISAGACTLGLTLSLTLLYQLNMLLDEDVDDFILLLAKFKPLICLPNRGSPTGLPDVLVILSGLAFLSMLAAMGAVVHMLCMPADAWIIICMFSFLVYVPFQLVTCQMDNWKWALLKKKDLERTGKNAAADGGTAKN